jgi:hypothetical protein
MEQALRELIKAAKGMVAAFCNNCEQAEHDRDCCSCYAKVNLMQNIAAAESSLQNGGWKKWPEEKPEKHDRYLVVDKTVGEFYISIDYWGGKDWIGYGHSVILWQPLPALPEDQPKGDKR